MGIPVKLKVDGFTHLGETFDKGDVFDAPHEAFASFLCDQENQATRVNESKLEPAKVGTMKRVTKGGSYTTKVMGPDDSSGGKPVKTKTGKGKGDSKSNVKAKSNESASKDT